MKKKEMKRIIATSFFIKIGIVATIIASIQGLNIRAQKKPLYQIQEISAPQLYKELSRNKGIPIVINVRPLDEHYNAHIAGSIHVSVKEIKRIKRRHPRKDIFREKLKTILIQRAGIDKIDESTDLVIYSRSAKCSTSSEAAQILHHNGFTHVQMYKDGVEDWSERYPDRTVGRRF